MAATGLLYTLLLFLCCFGAVHLVKLAKIGRDSLKPARKEDEKEEKPTKEKPKPVYYIVEKKRARKSSYTQPREITFSDRR